MEMGKKKNQIIIECGVNVGIIGMNVVFKKKNKIKLWLILSHLHKLVSFILCMFIYLFILLKRKGFNICLIFGVVTVGCHH